MFVEPIFFCFGLPRQGFPSASNALYATLVVVYLAVVFTIALNIAMYVFPTPLPAPQVAINSLEDMGGQSHFWCFATTQDGTQHYSKVSVGHYNRNAFLARVNAAFLAQAINADVVESGCNWHGTRGEAMRERRNAIQTGNWRNTKWKWQAHRIEANHQGTEQ